MNFTKLNFFHHQIHLKLFLIRIKRIRKYLKNISSYETKRTSIYACLKYHSLKFELDLTCTKQQQKS